MTALQASIGAANDVADATVDATAKPAKPIPAGLIDRRTGVAISIASLAVGLLIALSLGPPALAVALAILAIGFTYDFALKGTTWSWLPFAVGIPLLPVYAWLSAAGSLPGPFALLIPAAVVAGGALSIANSIVDVERDARAGISSIAVRLGRERAARVVFALHGLVVAVAWVTSIALGGMRPGLLLEALGAAVIAIGAILGAAVEPRRRERGWELQAIGVGLLAVGWLAVLGPAIT